MDHDPSKPPFDPAQAPRTLDDLPVDPAVGGVARGLTGLRQVADEQVAEQIVDRHDPLDDPVWYVGGGPAGE